MSLHLFLFRRIPSAPFLLLRRLWAGLTFFLFLTQIGSVSWFYSAESFLSLSPDLFGVMHLPAASLLFFVSDPTTVFLLYLFLLLLLICIACSIYPRVTMPLGFLLLLSFHQRNPFVMGGGDVLLHNVGFILLLATLFFEREMQKGTMPVWLRHLLLWQVIAIYVASAWAKLLGESWRNGTAVSLALQHPQFARFPLPAEFLSSVSPWIGYGTIVWEFLWVTLLVPGWKKYEQMKLFLLASGVIFHLGILLFLRVGSFSIAMLVAYVGLLDRWSEGWWSTRRST